MGYHFVVAHATRASAVSLPSVIVQCVMSRTEPHFWEFGIGSCRPGSIPNQNFMEQRPVDRSVLPTELWEAIILWLPPGKTPSMRLVSTSLAAYLGSSIYRELFARSIASSASSLTTHL